MAETKSATPVLALYPNRFGIGYALFGAGDDLIDCGMGYIQPASNRKAMPRVRHYLSYYKPSILLTRAREPVKKRLGKRLERLTSLIEQEARRQNLEVHHYTRRQIQNVFDLFKANTKYDISKKLVDWFPILKKYQFPKRKRWMNENHQTGVFDAVSLAMVYYYLD